MVKMSRQDGDGTWSVAGYLNDVARLAHIKSMIRTTHPDRICYRPGVMFTSVVCFSLREFGQGSAPHVLLGNPDGVDPESLARSRVIRERGPYTLHTQTVPFAQHSSFHPRKNSIWPAFHLLRIFHIRNSVCRHFTSRCESCADILHPDISHLDGRGGRFSFSGQTYPDPLISLTKRVFLSVYSATMFS